MRLRIALASLLLASCSTSSSNVASRGDPGLSFPSEQRISNLRQLTFGGTNAEAYWSFDGRSLSFQHSGEDAKCDQIFTIGADGKNKKRVSSGEGRTTCAYYTPNGNHVVYSSTHGSDKRCPPEPDRSQGYVWPLYPSYQFYKVRTDGTDIVPAEPGAPSAYNAELTACKDGKVVFTSDRNGDLDLYVGRLDSKGFITQVKQITNTLGYDGGAFFSPDCSKLVWRASRPRPGKETEEYVSLLRKHLFKPNILEIYTADADGSNVRQVTRFGKSLFAPYFTPDNERILFSANLNDPTGRKFNIYMIKTNGTELEQITNSGGFDSFPMFSPDGRHLAFSSSRNARKPRESNLFIADWNTRVPGPLLTDEDTDAVNRYYAVARELSSKDMEGRGVGTEGLNRAESYMIDLYTKLGLKELGSVTNVDAKTVKGYEHPVEIVTGVDADWTNTILKADWRHLKGKEEFAPAAFSSLGELKGQLIDVGYGIVAPELGIDDYTGKDTKGKVVLIRRRIPPALKLSTAQEANYGDLKYKTFLARERGANAVVFWEPEGDDKVPEKLTFSLDQSDGTVSSDSGIPVMFVPRKIAREWVAAPKPVIVSGNVALTKKKTISNNIIGVLGSADSCKNGPIVIGAHLDHLGFGGEGSLETGFARSIHHGADDNASGIAALIESARFLKSWASEGCFMFAAFTGEEIGVVGSSKLMDVFKKHGIQPKAMLNMDMVGRLKNNTLSVFGTTSAKEWNSILKTSCDGLALKCQGSGDGYGPSDHMPFYIGKIPVLHFFTGPHADYHRPSDTIEKLNATGGVQVAELVASMAAEVAKPKRSLTFVQQKTSNTMGSIRSRGDRKGAGAYLGSIPDYAQMAGGPQGVSPTAGPDGKPLPPVKGVRLSGVRPGSPAAEAGLAEGDIITAVVVLDEEPGYAAVQPKTYGVQNLQDYSFVLSNLKPGMRIRIAVKRKDRTLDLNAVVGRKTDGQN